MMKFEDGDQFSSPARTVVAADFQTSPTLHLPELEGASGGYLRWAVASDLAAQTEAFTSLNLQVFGEESWSTVAPLRNGDTIRVTTTVLAIDLQRDQPVIICRRDVYNKTNLLVMIGGVSLIVEPTLADHKAPKGKA